MTIFEFKISISSCINATIGMDIPLVMSKPHFLHGDELLSSHFEGLKPDSERHQTTLYAEPMTGTVLKESFNDLCGYKVSLTALTWLGCTVPI